jgi:hypothetical protein
LWSNGATNNSISVSPTVTTSYSVIVTNTNGCSAASSPVTVTVNSLPTVSLSLNPDTFCISAATSNLSGGLPNGGIYSGPGVSGGGYFNPGVAGGGLHDIIYTYTDVNNCSNSDTAQIYVDLCTGIESFSVNQNISIIPNPNNGIFSLNSFNKISSIEIVNVLGEKIYSSVINSNKLEIDLSTQPRGIYFVEVMVGNERRTKKIILE